MAIFTIAPFTGPALGPTVAGFVITSGLSWRWVFWIMTIFVIILTSYSCFLLFTSFQSGVCWIQILFTVPETYEYVFPISTYIPSFLNLVTRPILLVREAKRKRKETGDNRYYAPMERQNIKFIQRIENILARPFNILIHEPMLIAITIYMSVCTFLYSLPCIYIYSLVHSSYMVASTCSLRRIQSSSQKDTI
jgi:MFS family permease